MLWVMLMDVVVVGWGGRLAVSIDTLLALTNSPPRHHTPAQPRQPSSALPKAHANQPLPRGPAGRKRGGNTPSITPTWAAPW